MSSPPEQEAVTPDRDEERVQKALQERRNRREGRGDPSYDALLARLEAVEAERDAAHHALRQCIRLTGVDPSDGFPTQPPLHEFAVREVYRLRKEADAE